MDLIVAMEKDPAARSKSEVFFTYGGFKALFRYRIAHWFYTHHMKTIATIISAGGGAGGTCGDLVYSYGWGGAGGTIDTSNATIVSSTLNSNGNNGPVGSGSTTYPNVYYAESLYNGYGRGGGAGAGSTAGTVGFASVAWLDIVNG